MSTSKDVVLGYLEALGERDIERLLSLLGEDAEYHVPGRHPLAGVFAGHDAILNGFLVPMSQLFDAEKPYDVDVRNVVADGEHVVVECVTTATALTGRPYANPIAAVFTVRDGRIRRITEYFDTELFAGALFD